MSDAVLNPEGIIVKARNYIEDVPYRKLVERKADEIISRLIDISPTAPMDLQVQARLFREKIQEMILWQLDDFGRILIERERGRKWR